MWILAVADAVAAASAEDDVVAATADTATIADADVLCDPLPSAANIHLPARFLFLVPSTSSSSRPFCLFFLILLFFYLSCPFYWLSLSSAASSSSLSNILLLYFLFLNLSSFVSFSSSSSSYSSPRCAFFILFNKTQHKYNAALLWVKHMKQLLLYNYNSSRYATPMHYSRRSIHKGNYSIPEDNPVKLYLPA